MDESLRAVLTESERLLVDETEGDALGLLDEDGAIELETRIRRARDKYVSQYRRSASARVEERGASAAQPRKAWTPPGPGRLGHGRWIASTATLVSSPLRGAALASHFAGP